MGTEIVSPEAALLASLIARQTDLGGRLVRRYAGRLLAEATGLDTQSLNDAVEELEYLGFVEVMRTGRGPDGYALHDIEPTWRLLYAFHDKVLGELDPVSDPHRTAVAIVALDEATGGDGITEHSLTAELGWTLGRVLLAVAALTDSGQVTAIPGETGAPPNGFYKLRATGATRRLARGSAGS